MSPERRLAAIMFTDIVGYTALMAESEERGLAARQRHRELVRPLVGAFNGEVIETRADESLSTFPSALEAVNCALAIEDALQGEPGLRLHIGIHLGDIVLDQGEVSGDGINIASRICALSEGGGICVSGEVYRAIRNHPEIEATSLGEQDLKNVGQPVVVYSISRGAAARAAPELPDRGTERSNSAPTIVLGAAAVSLVLLVALAAWFWTSEPPPVDPIRSIAVLPLENLSGDADQEYFADGMTEALIGDLAKLGALRVLSRTSVMQYKTARKPLPEIARELNVDAVIEGTVMRAGDQVRITVQLIDAPNDHHLWSDRYDRDLRDILALQSEVARAVAAQIQLELTPQEAARFEDRPVVDPEAHDAYLRGMPHLMAVTVPGHLKAIEYFEQAIERDPEHALAYDGIARAYLGCAWVLGYLPPNEAIPKARAAAEKALASAYLEYSNQKDAFGLQIRPKNLLGAIWLQIAEYATGKRDYRDCKLCGAWIALEPRFNRKDRLYCSNACRQKAYRARNQ